MDSPVCILKGLLAFVTPRSSRVAIEAILINRLFAIHAEPVTALGEAQYRGLDFAEFTDVTIDLRNIDIHQQVGDRTLARICDPIGYLAISLIIAFAQLSLNVRTQLIKAIKQSLSDLFLLPLIQHCRS